MVGGNADAVIVGSAEIFVAPLTAADPDLTVWPVVIPAEWESGGFTKDGMEVQNSVTVKPIEVDELRSPVKRVIDKEDAKVSCKLSEATLDNIDRALSTATLGTRVPAGPSNVGSRTVTFGGGDLKFFKVMIIGPSEDGYLGRVFLGYKALAQGNVTFTNKRTEETIIGLELGLVADTDRSEGDNVWSMTDIEADHTT